MSNDNVGKSPTIHIVNQPNPRIEEGNGKYIEQNFYNDVELIKNGMKGNPFFEKLKTIRDARDKYGNDALSLITELPGNRTKEEINYFLEDFSSIPIFRKIQDQIRRKELNQTMYEKYMNLALKIEKLQEQSKIVFKRAKKYCASDIETAILTNDKLLLIYLFDKGESPNTKINGLTALGFAIQHKASPEIISLIKERGGVKEIKNLESRSRSIICADIIPILVNNKEIDKNAIEAPIDINKLRDIISRDCEIQFSDEALKEAGNLMFKLIKSKEETVIRYILHKSNIADFCIVEAVRLLTKNRMLEEARKLIFKSYPYGPDSEFRMDLIEVCVRNNAFDLAKEVLDIGKPSMCYRPISREVLDFLVNNDGISEIINNRSDRHAYMLLFKEELHALDNKIPDLNHIINTERAVINDIHIMQNIYYLILSGYINFITLSDRQIAKYINFSPHEKNKIIRKLPIDRREDVLQELEKVRKEYNHSALRDDYVQYLSDTKINSNIRRFRNNYLIDVPIDTAKQIVKDGFYPTFDLIKKMIRYKNFETAVYFFDTFNFIKNDKIEELFEAAALAGCCELVIKIKDLRPSAVDLSHAAIITIQNDDIDMFKVLISNFNIGSLSNNYLKDPFCFAILHEKWDFVRLLLKKNIYISNYSIVRASVTAPKDIYECIVKKAFKSSKLSFEAIKIVIVCKNDVLFQEILKEKSVNISTHKNELLHYAIEYGTVNMIKMLINIGAQLDSTDKLSRKPLRIAIEGENLPVIDFIINQKINHQWDACLLAACAKGYKGIVELMIENGANECTKNGDGENSLIVAIKNHHNSIAEMILEKNPYIVDMPQKDGSTALTLACKHNNLEGVKLLLKYGALNGKKNQEKEGVYKAAIQSDNIEIFDAVINDANFSEESFPKIIDMILKRDQTQGGHKNLSKYAKILINKNLPDDFVKKLYNKLCSSHNDLEAALLCIELRFKRQETFVSSLINSCPMPSQVSARRNYFKTHEFAYKGISSSGKSAYDFAITQVFPTKAMRRLFPNQKLTSVDIKTVFTSFNIEAAKMLIDTHPEINRDSFNYDIIQKISSANNLRMLKLLQERFNIISYINDYIICHCITQNSTSSPLIKFFLGNVPDKFFINGYTNMKEEVFEVLVKKQIVDFVEMYINSITSTKNDSRIRSMTKILIQNTPSECSNEMILLLKRSFTDNNLPFSSFSDNVKNSYDPDVVLLLSEFGCSFRTNTCDLSNSSSRLYEFAGLDCSSGMNTRIRL